MNTHVHTLRERENGNSEKSCGSAFGGGSHGCAATLQCSCRNFYRQRQLGLGD